MTGDLAVACMHGELQCGMMLPSSAKQPAASTILEVESTGCVGGVTHNGNWPYMKCNNAVRSGVAGAVRCG